MTRTQHKEYQRLKTRGYFEEYRCGCVSECVRYKKDLPGYCPKHGDDRRHIYPAFDPTEEL